MLVELQPHPDTPCAAIDSIDVEVRQSPGGMLSLTYRTIGDIGALRVPEHAPPVRSDGLWQHMCFELFLHISGETYREYNLSPSTAWAAYGFLAYRAGMTASPGAAPVIETRRSAEMFEMHAKLDLADRPPDLPMRIGLSAVIEDQQGGHSYWALAHPPGRPDFHHEDCFALHLPPAKQS